MGILKDLANGNFKEAMAGIAAMQSEINAILATPKEELPRAEDMASPSELDTFLETYTQDDTVWWCLESGEQQNLFDELLGRYETLRNACMDARQWILHHDDLEDDSDYIYRTIRRALQEPERSDNS